MGTLHALFAFILLSFLLVGCALSSPSSATAPANPLGIAQPAATANPPAAPAPDPTKIRIVLAGDSTVNTGSGWGSGFAKVLDSNVLCINLAKNGRSSRSYIDEGWWKQCLAAQPNYVLIQFGHNDQPGKGPKLETDPQTTYKQFLSQYIDESRAIGAKPILITSLERRSWTADGKIKPSLTDYAQAVRELGKAKNVPVIDLNSLSITLYEKLGKDAVNALSATTAQRTVDNTHLNSAGADVIGPIVADELKKLMPELAAHIADRVR